MSVSVVVVNKDDPQLDATLSSLTNGQLREDVEILVVDASEHRLDSIRQKHPGIRWIDYQAPTAAPAVTIAHQRNVGVRAATGDIVVFTDAGCLPQPGWLKLLVDPIETGEEDVTCGPAISDQPSVYSGPRWSGSTTAPYVREAATINLGFRRAAFDAVGGFDEAFAAGEDLDFTWRLGDAGYRLRWIPEATVLHDWGGRVRQVRRAWFYGRGWARLYRKHLLRRPAVARRYPVPIIYAVFVAGLPLSLRHRWYPLLLAVPACRARHEPSPALVLAEHLVTGTGVLFEAGSLFRSYWRA